MTHSTVNTLMILMFGGGVVWVGIALRSVIISAADSLGKTLSHIADSLDSTVQRIESVINTQDEFRKNQAKFREDLDAIRGKLQQIVND